MSGNCIHDPNRFNKDHKGGFCSHVCIGAECPRHPEYNLPSNVKFRSDKRRLFLKTCSDEELLDEIKSRLRR